MTLKTIMPIFLKNTICNIFSGHFNLVTFDEARISCRAFWTGADLFTGPIPDSDVTGEVFGSKW